jgi:excisionase family DNA binding protein
MGMPNIQLNQFVSKGRKRMSPLGEDQKPQTRQLLTDNILTAREVAAYLRLTVTTVCNLAASGELPGFKIGKSWRFSEAEVLKRIAAAKPKAKPKP